MKIQILGTGCPKCKQLADSVKLAIEELSIEAEIEKVTDLEKIMSFGVMMTPALAIDGEVKTMGKIPTSDKIKQLLKR